MLESKNHLVIEQFENKWSIIFGILHELVDDLN